MRAVVQRVTGASVTSGREICGSIERGMVVLLGVAPGDEQREIAWMVRKLLHLRMFDDREGKMNRSILDTEGSLLIVSQFTLYADTSRGNRPGFSFSAPYDTAKDIYDRFVSALRSACPLRVETGYFGASMSVRLSNDGPVTLIIDTP
ncbi:MAG TPA: D-tyrosyl-tRNA(Tyr) deacylase [Prosthecochloris aestuarii]|uniref:D-aminoacyl-tRNA deacylase n=1 Tax=Prosthecochloris aestuarii TaxID=1102 RepID=A0A831WNG4_PROAE|nr:D-tyrosyl-tRNA(Tyr) deacylase [Prosthecochloris aestuarii]